jgi:RimJ/RimL family protein N-acetyltransferase
MNRLKLYFPTANELEYRRKLIADEETMEYNIGYGENGTGCYFRTPEQIKEWYQNLNNGTDNFYAYSLIDEVNIPVGEVSIHYSDYYHKHIVGIIIEACHRGKGYAQEALTLLVKYAFYEMNLNEIADDIPIERTNADALFKKIGFERLNDELVVLTKENFEIQQISNSIAPCGLVCKLCHFADSCNGCKSDNNCCGLRKTAEGCYQYNCCEKKRIDGCWDCNIAPCEKGMFSKSHDVRLRGFITYIKQNGKDKLADRLYHNAQNGIYYGHGKDYDNLGSVEAVFERIEGK